MPGVLNFVIGAQNQQLLSALGGANLGLTGMFTRVAGLVGAFGALTGAGAGIAGVFKEINAAGNAFDLASRLRLGVAEMERLKFALQQVGESGEAAGPMITAIRKSMGGIGEDGQPTATA